MDSDIVLSDLFKLKCCINFDEIKDLDVTCKSNLINILNDPKSLSQDHLLLEVQAILDYSYERINIGNWKEVKPFLRKTITIASFIKLLLFIKTNLSKSECKEDNIKKCFEIIDYGLLFGCPIDGDVLLLQKCADILNKITIQPNVNPNTITCNTTQSNITKVIDNWNNKIDVLDCPSMETFYKNYISANKPVVLRKCIDHWPAKEKWKDHNYLLNLAGLRTVPIELGSKYTDSEWTQKLMTLKEFISDYILSTDKATGYLAQYQLFEQIPELKKDIIEPEYCYFSETDEPIDINAWYGPKGTISPLHHDPKKNLLAQVVGKKLIILFSQSESENLYPYETELMSNTAQADIRFPDFNKYPKFQDAKGFSCVLHEGEMLYIPPKYWHYVESLSISFSVSFWWK